MYRYNAPGMLQDPNLLSLNRAQGDDFAYMVALPASHSPWITMVATLLVVQSVICVPCHMCCGGPILLSMQLTIWNAELDVLCF